MANLITTSLVVQFGQTDRGILTAEIDDRVTGYNSGDAQFAPGEEPAFLIFKTSNVALDSIAPSSGSILFLSNTVNITKDEFINFEDSKTANTAYPVTANFTYQWIGNSLGAVTVGSEQNLTAATKGVAVLKVTYTSQAMARRLTGVPITLGGETSFPVLIYIVGTAP